MTTRILVIDDSSERCEKIFSLLQNSIVPPHEIICCRTYEEAFGHLFLNSWDLVLINNTLPTDSGLQILKRVHAFSKKHATKTILYGGESDLTQKEEALRAGAHAVLRKEELTVDHISKLLC